MAFNMFTPLRGMRAQTGLQKTINAGAKVAAPVKVPSMSFKMPKAPSSPGLNKLISTSVPKLKAPSMKGMLGTKLPTPHFK